MEILFWFFFGIPLIMGAIILVLSLATTGFIYVWQGMINLFRRDKS